MENQVKTSTENKEQQLKKLSKMTMIRSLLPIAGLIIIFLMFNALTNFRMMNNLPLVLSQVYVTMISATGVFFIMTMGGLDFSQGSILGIASIVVCMVSKTSIPLAIVAGIAVGAAIGAINGYFYVYRKIKSFIVTICTMFLFRGFIKYLTTNAPVAGSAMLINFDSTELKLACTLAVLIIGFVLFRFTKFGTYLKAIGAGEKAAMFSGIRTDRMKFLIYTLAGAITGFAAFINVIKVGSVTSSGGNQLETQILIALVLGGMPISGGAKVRFENIIVGSLLYIVLNSGLTMMGFTTQMMQLIQGVVFLIFVGRTLIMSGVLRNMDKFPSEHMLQNKFGYSRQTVRNALDRLEQDGLIARVKGSGTYVSYAPEKNKEERPRIGLILSYFSDYLFPQVYEGIESVLREEGYEISGSVTRNRLNDEALYLKGMLGRNVSGLIIEGTRSSFPNPNLRLYKEIRRRNIPTLFIHNHYQNETFDSVEMSDARAGYELTRILIQNGHTRIGGIFKYDDWQGIERYRGFIECLSDFGIDFQEDWIRWYSTRDMEEKLSKKGLQRMYRRTKDCTAMILYNDEVAGSYMDFLKDRGLRVPEDISLVSFDDAGPAQEGDLTILSVIHPKYNLGRLTARNLLRMIEDPDWQEKKYSYRFPVMFNNGNSVRDIH